ncbi:hypothetical protein NS226_22615 [Aureimonas ureilytica]|uniref:Calcium-binding protein n=1 Tax=Aureimonas ureilytica TaxID=401562 RepID=A0A175R0Y6_9HYPH|nr:calcium-binding protein [Aureimonas ureilytica]KTQ81466.1 hypothetical protein NS226_22615 [Aureimonas ureilytica]
MIAIGDGGNNVVMGGASDDTISIGSGSGNIAFGDFGVTLAPNGTAADAVGRHADAPGNGRDTITIVGGRNVVMGGGEADRIDVGSSDNVIFGDAGALTREAVSLRVLRAETADEASGGNDVIAIGDGGNNVVMGGASDDTISIGSGSGNIAFGDFGVTTAPNGTTPDAVGRHAGMAQNGADNITIAGQSNVAMGGGGGDRIAISGGDNVVFGDAGALTRAAGARSILKAETAEEMDGGSDRIDVGDGGLNVVMGGAADDILNIAGGIIVALGDFGVRVAPNGSSPDTAARHGDLAANGRDTITIASGSAIAMGGGDDDAIRFAGQDAVIFGDVGEVTRAPDRRLVMTQTVEEAIGGNDRIEILNGDTIVLGGQGADAITAYAGRNTILGDLGAVWAPDGAREDVVGRNSQIGGGDHLSLLGGVNVVMGEAGDDLIEIEKGENFVFGDTGAVVRDPTTLRPLAMRSTEIWLGGDDRIAASNGENYLIGGIGRDRIDGGAGADDILGDNGAIRFNRANIAVEMTSTHFDAGGDDTITGGNGRNVMIGGTGSDILLGGADRDQIIGDQGRVEWLPNGFFSYITTLNETPLLPAHDVLIGGGGNDNLLGGKDADDLSGGEGSDILIGDDGRIWFRNDQEIAAETLNQFAYGPDRLDGGPGRDFLFGGGRKGNVFIADPLEDLIFNTVGHIDLDANRVATWSLPFFLGDPNASSVGQWFRGTSHMSWGGSRYSSLLQSDGFTDSFQDRRTSQEADPLAVPRSPALFDPQEGAGSSETDGKPTSVLDLLGLGKRALDTILQNDEDGRAGSAGDPAGSLAHMAEAHAPSRRFLFDAATGAWTEETPAEDIEGPRLEGFATPLLDMRMQGQAA